MLLTTATKRTWLTSLKVLINRVISFKMPDLSREVFSPQVWMTLLEHQYKCSLWAVAFNLSQYMEISLVQICHLRTKDNISREWVLRWIWIKANSKLTFNNNNQWWEEASHRALILQCSANSNLVQILDHLAKWTQWISYRTSKLQIKINKRSSEIIMNDYLFITVRKYTKLG